MAKGKQKSKKTGGVSGFQIAVIAIALLIVAAGAATGIWMSRGGSDNSGGTGGKPTVPDYAFASTAPKGTAEAYQFAIDNPDVLKYIPCYCGCGELDGHTSNLDCFIKSIDGDKIVFDKHAAG